MSKCQNRSGPAIHAPTMSRRGNRRVAHRWLEVPLLGGDKDAVEPLSGGFDTHRDRSRHPFPRSLQAGWPASSSRAATTSAAFSAFASVMNRALDFSSEYFSEKGEITFRYRKAGEAIAASART